MRPDNETEMKDEKKKSSRISSHDEMKKFIFKRWNEKIKREKRRKVMKR